MTLKQLTPEQCEFFNRNGYLHVSGFVPESLLNNTQRSIEKWVDRAIHRWIKKGRLSHDFADLPFDLRLYRAWEAAQKPPYKESLTKEIASAEVFNMLAYSGFVDLVQDLLGGNNIQSLAGYMCRPKLPSRAFPIDTPWHQDAQCHVYRKTHDANFITIWIPFMDVDETNACLQVSEASHISKRLFEDAKNGTIHYSIHPEHSDQFTNLRAIPMKRGDALCLHQLVAHRSLPNHTDRMRWSLDIRFERFDSYLAPAPRRGFICAHEDPTKIEDTFEARIADLWAYMDQTTGNVD